MKRLSVTLLMVALINSIVTMTAYHRHNGIQQKPQQWTCTWEQAEGVELDEHGKQTTKSWKKMTGKNTVQASNKAEAITKFKQMTPLHVETKNWVAHCTQQ